MVALLCCGSIFCWYGLVPILPLEGSITVNQDKFILSDCLYLMIKYFDPDISGLFQDASAPNESFDEDENDIYHMMWHSQSQELNLIEHEQRFWQTMFSYYSHQVIN